MAYLVCPFLCIQKGTNRQISRSTRKKDAKLVELPCSYLWVFVEMFLVFYVEESIECFSLSWLINCSVGFPVSGKTTSSICSVFSVIIADTPKPK